MRVIAAEKLFLVGVCLVLVGCATPQAVKKLSAEQVKTQASFEQSLQAYFSVIEQLAANQVVASSFVIDDATNSIVNYRKRQTLKTLENADAARELGAGKQSAFRVLLLRQRSRDRLPPAPLPLTYGIVSLLKSCNIPSAFSVACLSVSSHDESERAFMRSKIAISASLIFCSKFFGSPSSSAA